MTQTQRTTRAHYQQLQPEERGVIATLYKQKQSCRSIAAVLHRSVSTISREIKRGSVRQLTTQRHPYQAYFSDAAQRIHEEARSRCHPDSLLIPCQFCFDQLTQALMAHDRFDSVDTFIYNFKLKYPHLPCPSVPTVYRYIDQGVLNIKNSDLPMKLRRRIKNPDRHRHAAMNKKKLGQSIEDRSPEVDERRGVGHWEGDLVKGKREASEPALMTLTERYSRAEIVVKIPNYHANTCRKALQGIIDDYGAELFDTITFDNGSEFSKLSQVHGTEIYFAHPYSPWERGSNENANGLLREFFPKHQSMRKVSLVDVQHAQYVLNHRHRKSLGYLCPADFYHELTA